LPSFALLFPAKECGFATKSIMADERSFAGKVISVYNAECTLIIALKPVGHSLGTLMTYRKSQ
jgi:hypothetical protein